MNLYITNQKYIISNGTIFGEKGGFMRNLLIAVFITICLSIGTGLAVEGDVSPLSKAAALARPTQEIPQTYRDTIEVIIGTPVIGNVIPFWGGSYDACRFQVLFLQNEINTQGDIIEFAFMPSSNSIGTYNNVRVFFCHTNVGQLSPTFDSNYAGNTPIEVINEPNMSVGGSAGSWMPWDVNFSYNNADNLLVEIKWNGDSGQNVALYRTGEPVPRRVYAWDDNATSGSTQNTGNYVRLKIVTLSVAEDPAEKLKTALGPAIPNPFTGKTRISYTIEKEVPTAITIFDASGRKVRTLVDRIVGPGIYTSSWDGRDENGRSVTTGIYFYRLASGSLIKTRKLIYLR